MPLRSPMLAFIGCAFMHFDRFDTSRFVVRPFLQRWVDDIWIMIQFWYKKCQHASAAKSLAVKVESHIVGTYWRFLRMKREDDNIFIGVHMERSDDNRLRSLPVNYVDWSGLVTRHRFQHWYGSCVNVQMLHTVVGMIYQICDRVLDEEDLATSLCKIFLEFRAVPFPWQVLRSAFRRFVARYPFLLDGVQRGLLRTQMVEDIVRRKIGKVDGH